MAPARVETFDSYGADRSQDFDVPVLIVGGGPSGLLQSYILSRFGIKSLIIERYAKRLAAPKAHALSPRTLELCRQTGLDVNRIRALGTSRQDAYWVNFVTNLSGHRVGSLPYERMDREVLADTPTMIHNISQPVFEQLVADHLKPCRDVELRKNHSFVDVEQNGDSATSTIEDRDTGATYQVRSRFVIACDGGKSKTREALGIECEGESSYETMMTIHFNADLRPVVGDNVGMLHWIMEPDVSGFIIGYDLGCNQVLICNFNPAEHPLESWNEELCSKIVTAAIGKSIPFDILSYRPWVLSRKVAESYRVGNVLLAGDAAHAFPPTGGLGLNCGLADVHNLAYKIAANIQGWGGSDLLDTYESDRRQVALNSSLQSVKNGKQIFSLLNTLGIVTGGGLQEAKANLHRRIRDAKTRHEIMRGVEAQREHFDNLALHIGYIYGSQQVPASASLYVHSYLPGARLSHAWVQACKLPTMVARLPPIDSSYVTELTTRDVDLKRYSTLDLCAFDAFTIIADQKWAWRWRQTLAQARTDLGKWTDKGLKINEYYLDEDFELVEGTRADEWVAGFQLRKGNAVIVRPDQHVLTTWLEDTGPSEVVADILMHLGLK